MKVYKHFRSILDEVKYPGFEFELVSHADEYWLRIACDGVDNETGKPHRWHGRPWRLSTHMTNGEVVQTAFLALKVAIEHEMRELFTYKGATVFNPHFDIDRLVSFASTKKSIKERPKFKRRKPGAPPKVSKTQEGVLKQLEKHGRVFFDPENEYGTPYFWENDAFDNPPKSPTIDGLLRQGYVEKVEENETGHAVRLSHLGIQYLESLK